MVLNPIVKNNSVDLIEKNDCDLLELSRLSVFFQTPILKQTLVLFLLRFHLVRYTRLIVPAITAARFDSSDKKYCYLRCLPPRAIFPGRSYSCPAVLWEGINRGECGTPGMAWPFSSDRQSCFFSIMHAVSALKALSIHKGVRSPSYKFDLDRSSSLPLSLSFSLTHTHTRARVYTPSITRPFCSHAELNYNSRPSRFLSSFRSRQGQEKKIGSSSSDY